MFTKLLIDQKIISRTKRKVLKNVSLKSSKKPKRANSIDKNIEKKENNM
ncbi:Uncharacterised protein [Mycoplasmopsis glycophila]|uniref:Uncharacterized protein n=1 Tax=Mycoplasmopsis glycophila TaxID=171285 RepID=A0A449AUE9_9BACT|nr:Uncharacterised protein [Mycoplasmopsis glycophila]